MRYELWCGPDQLSLTFVEAGAVETHKQEGILEPGAERIWSVDADSWNEANALYHAFMGWEPYQPMSE